MADYRYHLLDLRSSLYLLRLIFFSFWGNALRLRQNRRQWALIGHGIVLFLCVISVIGLFLQISSIHFDWRQATIGVIGGISFGAVVGAIFGVAIGVTVGVAAGLAFGVALGVVFDIFISIAFGVVFGVAFGVALGAASGVALDVFAGAVGGLALGVNFGFGGQFFQRAQAMAGNPLQGTAIGLVAFMSIAGLGMGIGYLTIKAFEQIIEYRTIRRQRSEWLCATAILIAASLIFNFIPPEALSLEAKPSTGLLAIIFILTCIRLPLWPLEALWGGLVYWRIFRNSNFEATDAAALAQQIRRAYFDRLMILPLPGEVLALRRLSYLDEDLAIREAAELASVSNHRWAAIAALRGFATQNPMTVQAYLNLDSGEGNRERNLNYTAEKLPEASARVWAANQRLQTLSPRLLPSEDGNQVGRSNQLRQASRPIALTEAENRGSTNLATTLEELREIVDDFAAAHSWNADLSHVDTHLLLWRTLLDALEAESVQAIATFEAPVLPEDAPLLYPDELREALARIATIAARVREYVKATSPVTRTRYLLEVQDALEKFEDVIETVPQPPGPFLALLVAHWRRLFATAGGELARVREAEPVPQPYVVANPIVGDGFVGREDVLHRLEELWAVPGQRPSVVLYGHRRMGKSSILQNLRGEQFGSYTRIVDFNLQIYGLVPSTGALLHNLALELYDACQAVHATPDWPEPDDAPFDREPYGAFRRFLRKLDHHRGDLRFIVTLDEFETLEKRIESGKLQPDLIDYLRGVITTQTWLTLAFAGLHTLQEMTEDYWHPLYGSVETIPVSFLNEGATRRLLTAPSPDFAVDYGQGALDFIYALTHGQPFLTQLIGHNLVTRLNEQMFEQQVEREARFDRADVEAVISADAFFRTGGAYFSGIWAQAGQGPPGQQKILRALADGPSSLEEILVTTELGPEEAEAAIEALERHDVLVAVEGEGSRKWRFTVELMRRWLGL